MLYYTGILYHGAVRQFRFDSGYKFDDETKDGSETLGQGIYLTDQSQIASSYSKVRQLGEEKDPIVYTVSAEDCKFLDFRGESGNLPVDSLFLSKWKDYYKKVFDDDNKRNPDLGPEFTINVVNGLERRVTNWPLYLRKRQQEYLDYLEQLSKEQNVDLRVMLGTAPNKQGQSKFPYQGSVIWGSTFRQFMTDELDYDGIIYIERTEDESKMQHASFVIYNMKPLIFPDEPLEVKNLMKG